MDTEGIIVTILFMALVIGCLIVAYNQDQKLKDPTDTEVVFTDQLREIAMLTGTLQYLVRIIRQSGNLQQDDKIFELAEQAVTSAVSTFRRAQIDHVVIVLNTQDRLVFRRSYHSGRGTKEGKKVGSVEISRL